MFTHDHLIICKRQLRCDVSIGFKDALYSLTFGGQLESNDLPGMDDMSWGYSSSGSISFADRLDIQEVETFGAGDIVGCHFDRSKQLAFFTVNGKVVGKPL